MTELIVVIVVAGIIGVLTYSFFAESYNKYIALQTDSLKFSDLSLQSQRIAKVLRGSTDVLGASSTEVTVYAYFTPRDAIVSKIRYYKDTTAKSIKADVTPMTSSPPIGTPDTANMKTYIILAKYYDVSGVNTFEYTDSAGATLATPIGNLHDIKGMRVNMTVPASTAITAKNTTLSTEVSLRNRKTNL